MDDEKLKGDLLRAIFRLKKIGVTFSAGTRLHMREFMVLHKIAHNSLDSDQPIDFADIQKGLHVSKPAISQMLNSLEKKGYIHREIDSKDRRRFKITLTPKGNKVMCTMEDYADKAIGEIISRFGEENTIQLINLFNQFADITDEVKQELLTTDIKGEEND